MQGCQDSVGFYCHLFKLFVFFKSSEHVMSSLSKILLLTSWYWKGFGLDILNLLPNWHWNGNFEAFERYHLLLGSSFNWTAVQYLLLKQTVILRPEQKSSIAVCPMPYNLSSASKFWHTITQRLKFRFLLQNRTALISKRVNKYWTVNW